MAGTLVVKNIETYYGPIMAIRGVSLEVRAGQIVTLLGANGAGKTTVLKTISGAMDPQKGTVELDGAILGNLDPDVIARRGIAHVPEGREVFPFLSVEENLIMGAFSRKDKGVKDDLKRVYEYFPALLEKREQAAGFLSGGQQQMLAIARFGVWTCHGFAPVLFPLPGRGAKTGAVGPAPFLLHFFFRLLPGCGTKTGAVEPPQVLPQLPSPSQFQDA